jgi:DNA-binding transcriptional ArsR family regulator
MSVAQTTQPGDGGRGAPDAVLRALADPHRRNMLKLVRNTELAVGQIATHFPMTQQAVSQHLHVLERAGLLTERRDGTKRLYAFRPESLEAVRNVLADLWPEALERLKHVVEQAKIKKHRQTKS